MDDAATEILEGTHRALYTHGYTDLTLEHIAAETTMSKATIHYYFDSKANLFTAYLEYLYDRYVEQIASVPDDRPRERLQSLLDVLLTTSDAGPNGKFRRAMLEVRAQAPYDDAIRTRLEKFDRFLYDELRSIIANGVDEDMFDEHVDPELTTEFLTAAISGAHTRHVAVDYPMDRLHEAARRYVDTQLVDETPEVIH